MAAKQPEDLLFIPPKAVILRSEAAAVILRSEATKGSLSIQGFTAVARKRSFRRCATQDDARRSSATISYDRNRAEWSNS